jgi:hypothetical protein
MSSDQRMAFRKKREQQRAEAPVAMAEYRAAQQAALDRIPRLRALRLARDAAGAKRADANTPRSEG